MNEDDVLNDYSHYHDRTGPYKRVDYIEYTHVCDGEHMPPHRSTAHVYIRVQVQKT